MEFPLDIIFLIGYNYISLIGKICKTCKYYINNLDTSYYKKQLIDKYTNKYDEEYNNILIQLPILSLGKLLYHPSHFPYSILKLRYKDMYINNIMETIQYKEYFCNTYLFNYNKYNILSLEQLEQLSIILYPEPKYTSLYNILLERLEHIYDYQSSLDAHIQLLQEVVGNKDIYGKDDIKLITSHPHYNINIKHLSYIYNNDKIGGNGYLWKLNSYEEIVGNQYLVEIYWKHIDNGGNIISNTWASTSGIIHMIQYSRTPLYILYKYKDVIIESYRSLQDREDIHYFLIGYDGIGHHIPAKHVLHYGIGLLIYVAISLYINRIKDDPSYALASITIPLILNALSIEDKEIFYLAMCKLCISTGGNFSYNLLPHIFTHVLKLLPKSSLSYYRYIIREIKDEIPEDVWNDISYNNIYGDGRNFMNYILCMLYIHDYNNLSNYLKLLFE
ncbi:Transmembrane domain-containing protein [Orpheovirus IHUMI-LCC2]|uniref:Transmembrane domain-containing protein n=1 Tax=Orpheovirus IHUMI-LCC2 TaxID=2023057 RepID=A0A2I2L348_9VIRU|nr:Transmembrane domain-containing protein [Orpheovirus IHUMI-LCC2]SNW61951.1 Transmembrane domain-containing protein [Orpheovirus IHUMI-LCC2]